MAIGPTTTTKVLLVVVRDDDQVETYSWVQLLELEPCHVTAARPCQLYYSSDLAWPVVVVVVVVGGGFVVGLKQFFLPWWW